MNGNLVGVHHKYNACVRAIEKHVRETARSEETYYHLTKSEGCKVDGSHVSGTRVWESGQKKLVYTVQLVD